MYVRTNSDSSFWTRKGKTEGKEIRKGTAEALEKMERGCMCRSEPFLSEQLTLFGMQSIVSGTCFENKKTAGSSWRNRVMAQWRAGRKLCTHYPHTYPSSLLPFCFIVCLWLSLNIRETPECGEKAHLFLQLLHCQPLPLCLGLTPMYTWGAWSHWSIVCSGSWYWQDGEGTRGHLLLWLIWGK